MAEITGIICTVILIVLIIFILISVSESGKLAVKEYEAGGRLLPAEFDGFRIAVLADLHNTIGGGRDKMIIERLRKIKPDIIILAGDMVVCTKKAHEKNLRTGDFLCRLADVAPCYYGYGNHERGLEEAVRGVRPDSYAHYMEIIKKNPNIIMLDNNSVKIRRGGAYIKLFGYNMDMDYYKRFINKPLYAEDMKGALGSKPHDEYCMLIAHNPDYFKTYRNWGANLVFAGHNHGGIVRLPFIGGVISPKVRLFPRYDYGKFEENDTIMLVSGGMGAHSIKLRVNNIPEILSVTLKKKG